MLNTGNKQTSFFKESVYNKIVPKNHILRIIKKNIDFSFINDKVVNYYSKNKGRKSVPPVLIFKIIFLKNFYNLSYNKIISEINLNLSFKYFCDLEVDQTAPSLTTINRFINKLNKNEIKKFLTQIKVELQKLNLEFTIK